MDPAIISKFLLGFILLFSNFYSLANKTAIGLEHQTYKRCTPTVNTKVDELPAEFSSYNNMTKSEGGFSNYLNKKILLRGVVKDKNCIPVSNARIKMWQVDAYGNKRYAKEFSTPEEIYDMNYLIYSKFKGTASSTSSNNGEFFIITVKPASRVVNKKKRDNYINFRVEHSSFPPVISKIYLLEKDEYAKRKDIVIAKNYNTLISGETKVYDFEIILDGVSKHSRY